VLVLSLSLPLSASSSEMSVLEDISKLCIARSLLAGSFSLVRQEENEAIPCGRLNSDPFFGQFSERFSVR